MSPVGRPYSDEAGFRALYEEHAGPLFRYIQRYMANAEAAEEVLQDVFERVLEGRFTQVEGSNIKAWLYSVARNRCLNLVKPKPAPNLHVANIDEAQAPDAESSIISGERERAFAKLEAGLPEDLRATWALRKQGKDYQSIAEDLSIPLGTVKSRFHRLVEYLRKGMLREDMPGKDIENELES